MTAKTKNGKVEKMILKFELRMPTIAKNNTKNPKSSTAKVLSFLFIFGRRAPKSNIIWVANPNKIIGCVKLLIQFSVLVKISFSASKTYIEWLGHSK
ncbi:hypothetical protein [Flavobacterium sp.]|uniref:hypothetical protein n=1 Tax=Flavobacterium sp. TaxID=239 RepID=UPI002616EA7F|nr:hypothetical protein [Flavobacterium sp.]